jgi:hypothetical protein
MTIPMLSISAQELDTVSKKMSQNCRCRRRARCCQSRYINVVLAGVADFFIATSCPVVDQFGNYFLQ